MEGNEPNNKYEDDELNPDSRKKDDADSDNFGLPDFEAAASGDSYEEKKDEEDEPYSYDESYESDKWDEEKSSEYPESEEQETELQAGYGSGEGAEEYGTGEEQGDVGGEASEPDDVVEEEYRSTYYEDNYGRKRSPVGWILLIVFIVLALIVGLFWWLNKDEEPVVVEKPKPTVTTPATEEPEPIETPKTEALEDRAQQEKALRYTPTGSGEVTRLSTATNKYYVVVASAIDDDLLMDYARKLTDQGRNVTILEPRGSTKFHRLAIAGFESLNDAALAAEQNKAEFGQGVWVKRY